MDLDGDAADADYLFGDGAEETAPQDIITPEQPFGLACHPTAPFVAVGLISGSVHVHEVKGTETRHVQTIDKLHQRGVHCMEFSEDGRHLFTASSDRTIKRYDAGAQASDLAILRTKSNPHKSGISALNVCNDQLITTGDDDGVVCLWDLRTPRKPTQVYEEHADVIGGLLYFSEMNTVVSCSGDTCMAAYDVRMDSTLGVSQPRKDELTCMAFIPATNDIICGTSSGSLPVWKYGSWKRPFDIHEKHPRDCDALLTYNDNIVLTAAGDGLVRVLQHHPVRRILTHIGGGDVKKRLPLNRMSVTHDRSLLVVCGSERAVQFHDLSSISSEAALDKLRGKYEAKHMATIRDSVMDDARRAEEAARLARVARGETRADEADAADDDDDDDDAGSEEMGSSLDSMNEDLGTDDDEEGEEGEADDAEEGEEEYEEDSDDTDAMFADEDTSEADDSDASDDDAGEGGDDEETEPSDSDSNGWETIMLNPAASKHHKGEDDGDVTAKAKKKAKKKKEKDAEEEPTRRKTVEHLPPHLKAKILAARAKLAKEEAEAATKPSAKKTTTAKKKPVAAGPAEAPKKRGKTAKSTAADAQSAKSVDEAAKAGGSYTRTVREADDEMHEPAEVLDRATKRARVAAAKWLKGARKDRVKFKEAKKKTRRREFFSEL